MRVWLLWVKTPRSEGEVGRRRPRGRGPSVMETLEPAGVIWGNSVPTTSTLLAQNNKLLTAICSWLWTPGEWFLYVPLACLALMGKQSGGGFGTHLGRGLAKTLRANDDCGGQRPPLPRGQGSTSVQGRARGSKWSSAPLIAFQTSGMELQLLLLF